MIDKEKVSNQYAEAVESMDNSVDTDISSMQRNNRQDELTSWDEAMARSVAADEGIELTDEHMQVVQTLRDYYREHGEVTGRVLTELLDTTFSDHGGQKYLRCLFPDGPVKQGMRIACLPVPAHTEDAGFGISR
jgi:tRNA 2-thiouridine synthesizing protein E